MREGEKKILGERIHHAESQFVLEVPAQVKWFGEVLERVVHPAHVPLEVEAEASISDRLRDPGPGRGFFSDSQNTGLVAVYVVIQFPDESDRIQVFLAAAFVGEPF